MATDDDRTHGRKADPAQRPRPGGTRGGAGRDGCGGRGADAAPSGQEGPSAAAGQAPGEPGAGSGAGRAPGWPRGRGPELSRRALVAAGCGLGVAGLLTLGGVLWWTHRAVDCTVNGRRRSVRVGISAQDIVNLGYASPRNGDLVSIADEDGQVDVLEKGGGNGYTITVNGADADVSSYRVAEGDVIVFTDGTDLTEETEEQNTSIPCGIQLPQSGYYLTKIGYVSQWGVNGVSTVETGRRSGRVVDRGVTTQPQDLVIATAPHIDPADGRLLVALTFDGGPSLTYTRQYLDILARYGAKATFFCLGSAIDAGDDYAALVRRCAEEGHQVASNSYAGSGLTTLTSDQANSDLTKSFETVSQAAGVQTNALRAPSGAFYGDTFLSYLRSGGDIAYSAYWGVDSTDWMYEGASDVEAGAAAIASACTGSVATSPSAYNGSIILMHDGSADLDCDVVALPTIIETYQAAGFSFVTLNELLASTGSLPDWVTSGYAARPEGAVIPGTSATVTYYTPGA